MRRGPLELRRGRIRACYSVYPEADIDKANAVNREYLFGRAYISSDGLACLSLPVATGVKGISYEAFDRSYDAFVWFTTNTDEFFGPQAMPEFDPQ